MLITLDPNDLTIGDLVLLEDAVGEDAVSALLDGKVTGKALRGLAWLALRRENPEATIDDADSVKITEFSSGSAEARDG